MHANLHFLPHSTTRGQQTAFNLLDLPQHGCLGLLQGRELPFSLVPLPLHILQLLAGGLILLKPEGTNSLLIRLRTVVSLSHVLF